MNSSVQETPSSAISPNAERSIFGRTRFIPQPSATCTRHSCWNVPKPASAPPLLLACADTAGLEARPRRGAPSQSESLVHGVAVTLVDPALAARRRLYRERSGLGRRQTAEASASAGDRNPTLCQTLVPPRLGSSPPRDASHRRRPLARLKEPPVYSGDSSAPPLGLPPPAGRSS